MSSITNRGKSRVQHFHIADDCVWATICYLDSPTNFREHLPEEELPKRGPSADEPLILLDNASRHIPWNSLVTLLANSILLIIVAMLMLRG